MADVMELIKQHEAKTYPCKSGAEQRREPDDSPDPGKAGGIRDRDHGDWPEDRRGRFPEGRKTRENRCDPGGHRRPAHV